MSKIHVEHDRLIIKSLFSSREIPYNSIERMLLQQFYRYVMSWGYFYTAQTRY